MKTSCRSLVLSLSVLVLSLSQIYCQEHGVHSDHEGYYVAASRPLVRRPPGTHYKTIMSVDGGGMRGMINAMVLLQVEQSVKEYLLAHPEYLPSDAHITSVDDFEINLVDYFDCMTGVGMGAWTSMYLASRGGQGASNVFLQDPAIIERYGVIHPGEAAGLRVFFREYGSVVYPPEAVGEGERGDISDPNAPGTTSIVYPLEGMTAALTDLLGDTTLEDLDTSCMYHLFDMISGYTTMFTQNRFHDAATTAYARMVPRVGPKEGEHHSGFLPDLEFREGDFYLKDLASGANSVPVFNPGTHFTEIHDPSIEFTTLIGGFALEDADFPTSFYVARENGLPDFEYIAVLSLGNGRIESDFSALANAGLGGWMDGLQLFFLYHNTGRAVQVSLMDYMFYSNPNTGPYQYLRIQVGADADTETGQALYVFDNLEALDLYEELGRNSAEDHEVAIDAFVERYIFG